MGPDMTQDTKPPAPGSEFDRRTPLSRLRYKDIEVRTWRIVVAVVVMLALLALIGFGLARLEARHSSKRNTGESMTLVIP
jgi:hypothetical protein